MVFIKPNFLSFGLKVLKRRFPLTLNMAFNKEKGLFGHCEKGN